MRRFNILFLLVIALKAFPENWVTSRGDATQSGRSGTSIKAKPVRLWSFALGEEIRAPAAVSSKSVLVCGADGAIACLDRTSGKLLWSNKTGSGFEAGAAYAAGAGERGAFVAADLSGALRAYDEGSGALKWEYAAGKRISGGALAIGKGLVAVGSYDNFLHAVSLADGKPRFKIKTGSYVAAAPSEWKGFLLFGGCDGFLRLSDGGSGARIGEAKLESYIPGSVPVLGNTAYALTYEGGLYAVSLPGLRFRILADMSDMDGAFPASPAIDGESIYACSRDGWVARVRQKDGKRIWTVKREGQIAAAPAVAGGFLIVVDSSGYLSALAVADGREAWAFELGAGSAAPPSVCDGRIYIGTVDGRFLCLGAK
jgi:outer membrane protein assembly factor BamB